MQINELYYLVGMHQCYTVLALSYCWQGNIGSGPSLSSKKSHGIWFNTPDIETKNGYEIEFYMFVYSLASYEARKTVKMSKHALMMLEVESMN